MSELYRAATGHEPERIDELPIAGSNRRYFRLHGRVSLIGALGLSSEENATFIYYARHFRSKGLPVPEIVGVSDDGMAYLQQDLGTLSLFDAIAGGRESGSFSEAEIDLLKKAIRVLPDFQFIGAEGLDFRRAYPPVEFDMRSVMWDFNYFKYCFLKASGVEFREDRLEDEFQALAARLLEADSPTFMYRDFQSRNVMIKDGEPWCIDFQSGRRGPYYYDVASFLWQAKANLPSDLRRELASEYKDALDKHIAVDSQEFDSTLALYALFRTLQVLGVYGFRGYFERKSHFLQSIPYAISNLRELLDANTLSGFPYLESVLSALANSPRFAVESRKPVLTIRVASFSYRKGIPSDPSGNGGGFVFDCRALHNPGLYDEYKHFTGMDAPVAKFLEGADGTSEFLSHCYALVDAAAERYIARGYTSLMVSFGCTGGRHRSVYCAQRMAEHLCDKHLAKIILTHREQDVERTLTRLK